jgi:thiol:disulfide interchange protein
MTMMIGTAVAMAEPLVPSFGILGYFLVVNAVLFLGALISIARTRDHTTGSQVVWALIVLALPVIGALTWFVIGRRAKNTAALKQ